MDSIVDDDERRITDVGDAADLLIVEDTIEEVGPNLPVTSYRMKPSLKELFPASHIKSIIQTTIYDKLQGNAFCLFFFKLKFYKEKYALFFRESI